MIKWGSIVKCNGNEARVTSSWQESDGKVVCRIKYTNTNITPNEIEVDAKALMFSSGHSNKFSYKEMFERDERCPNCSSRWHITESPIFGKKEVWVDCLKCNMRKEDIVK